MLEIQENTKEHTVQLGPLRIEGWVAPASCIKCHGRVVHYAVFDAQFCPECNQWTARQCTMPDCYLCSIMPERPLIKDSGNRFRSSGVWSRLMLVAGMALGGCSKPADAPKPTEAIIEGLGSHHMAVTATPEAQRLFDQGLRLAYGFNHPEAERSFRAAAALDPSCAMCWWGTALVLGPNINLPMDPAAAAPAWEALSKARAGAAKVSDRERAYIEALTARYADPAPASRAPLDSAYSRAMAQVAQQFPTDLDAQVLYAESLMDLSPWNYWDAKGQPNPGLEQLVPILERSIAADSMNPGACHYYIHAVEKVKPALAVPCAERLASLMPAAGHLVHMPAHIYARVGRYNDAVDANVHAVHADQTFIADRPGQQSVYLAIYYPHNYHFLAFASAFAGRSKEALTAAAAASEHTPLEIAQLAVEAEYLVPARFVYLAEYGRWDDILALPLPPDTLHAARGMALYARGSALAAKGRGAEASAALDTVQALAKAEPVGIRKQLLEISAAMLAGNIAQQQGNTAKAIGAYQRAAAGEDGLPYMEPAFWHHPTRLTLGAALLRAHRAKEAAAVYRAVLAQYPESGEALYGLSKSLEASGGKSEAAALEPRIAAAWSKADIPLAAP
jgi:tetratricopeptide (TPR) repeat protein